MLRAASAQENSFSIFTGDVIARMMLSLSSCSTALTAFLGRRYLVGQPDWRDSPFAAVQS